jgi:RNA polymerase sigma factor (sigma-70 family)
MAAETQKLLGYLLRLTDQATSDGGLLRRWAEQKDENAFAALVARHGPMVLGVCQRVLGDRQHAEDAFQATFLVLARKAATLQRPEALPGFLYGVALRLARKARATRRCRSVPLQTDACERADPQPHALDALSGRELLAMVDAEVARLPEVYRLPVLLCVIQERSVEEAARILCWTAGLVRSRLARGRQMLRERLMDRGLAPSGGALALLAPARLPQPLLSATLRNLTSAVPGAVKALAAGTSLGLGIKTLCVACVLAAVGLAIGLPLPLASEAPPPLATVPPALVKKEPRHVDLLGDPLPPGAIMRLGALRYRNLYPSFHERDKTLPDQKTLLTTGQQDIRWVDTVTGRVIDAWPLPKDHRVYGFSCDCQMTLLGIGEALSLWHLGIRKKLHDLEYKGRLTSQDWATFSPDGKTVAATIGGANLKHGLAGVWDTASGRKLWESSPLDSPRWLRVIGFLPNSQTLVLADGNNEIVLRDRASGRVQRAFATMPFNETRQLGLSPDGKAVVFGTSGTSVRAWDIATGKELPALGGHTGQAYTFAFSADSKTVVTGGGDPFALVRDWPNGKLRRRIDIKPGRGISRVGVSPDGQRLVCEYWGECALAFFDLRTGKELPSPQEAHRGIVYGVALAPDGKVISAGIDNTIRVWDLKSGRNVRVIQTNHPLGAQTMSISPDGCVVATADANHGIIALHELNTGRLVRTISSQVETIYHVEFAPEGHVLASSGLSRRSASQPARRYMIVWDSDAGTEVRRWEDATPGRLGSHDWAISPDGQFFAQEEGNHVKTMETSTGREWRTLPKQANCLAFSPDGRTLASRDDKGISLWELASGQERCRIDADFAVSWKALCFSPNGHWLASAAKNGQISVWDACKGQLVQSFAGHEATVVSLVFTRDSRVLISASFDTTLLAWDTASLADRRPDPHHLSEKTIAAAWGDLRSTDAKAAYRAVQTLVDAPALSLPLLRKHLQKAPPVDPKEINRWLAQLDSNQFAERNQAVRELERQGDNSLAPLRRLLAGRPSLEGRRRAERLLDRLDGPVTDPDRLQQMRALEVVEFIGNIEARQLLAELARGYSDAPLTKQASAALNRLRRQARIAANP